MSILNVLSSSSIPSIFYLTIAAREGHKLPPTFIAAPLIIRGTVGVRIDVG